MIVKLNVNQRTNKCIVVVVVVDDVISQNLRSNKLCKLIFENMKHEFTDKIEIYSRIKPYLVYLVLHILLE